MDPATIQGVVRRLIERQLIVRASDPKDGRRNRLTLAPAGERLIEKLTVEAFKVSRDTLKPLSETERARFLEMLSRLG